MESDQVVDIIAMENLGVDGREAQSPTNRIAMAEMNSK
jgi:hypothetical protein